MLDRRIRGMTDGPSDEARAADMMERLLSPVMSRGSTHAILDLTAVDRLETTAEDLLRMIQALDCFRAFGRRWRDRARLSTWTT